MMNEEIQKGDIYLTDLSPVVGSEQGGVRPCVVIQNNVGNKFSPTIIVAAITSKLGKTKIPTHIEITGDKFGLSTDSVILAEQIRTIDKKRLMVKLGKVKENVQAEIDNALRISLNL